MSLINSLFVLKQNFCKCAFSPFLNLCGCFMFCSSCGKEFPNNDVRKHKDLNHFEVRVGGKIKFRGFRVVRFVPENGNRLL